MSLNSPLRRAILILLALIVVFAALEGMARVYSQFSRRAKMWALRKPLPLVKLFPLDRYGFRNKLALMDTMRLQAIISDVLRLEYVHLPEYNLLDPEFSYQTISINQMGFRGSAWAQARQQNEFRIFLVGGSTAFSLYAEEDSALHVLLEQSLARALGAAGRIPRVYCAAIPGATSRAEVAIVEDLVLPLKPDIVVVLNGVNDLNDGVRRQAAGWRNSALALNRVSLVRNVRLLHLFANKLATLAYTPVSFHGAAASPSRIKAVVSEVVQRYGENMQSLQRWLSRAGIPLVVCLQPDLLALNARRLPNALLAIHRAWQEHAPVRFQIHRQGYARLLENLERRRMNVFAANQLLMASGTIEHAGPVQIERIFFDAVHLTPAGNRALAAWLSQAILRHGRRRNWW